MLSHEQGHLGQAPVNLYGYSVLITYSVLLTGASAGVISRLPWSPTGSTTPAALGQLFGARVHKDRTANTIATSKARPIAISSKITVFAFFEGPSRHSVDLPFRKLTQAGQYYTGGILDVAVPCDRGLDHPATLVQVRRQAETPARFPLAKRPEL